MEFSRYLKKAIDPSSYKIGMAKFTSVSSKVLKEPNKAYPILKDEFFEEMRNKAIAEIMEENKDIWKKMSIDDKEVMVKEREDKLWESIKSKGKNGLAAFAVIFGISI
tara:strand:- start:492 stop:815 length:324 start_codon:yes stop_codon:yes gene_type:complete